MAAPSPVSEMYLESSPGKGDAPRRSHASAWQRFPTRGAAVVLWLVSLVLAIAGSAGGVALPTAMALGGIVVAGLLFAVPTERSNRREAQHARRVREGRCVSCGYMLRGLTYGARARCPECGRKADQS